MPESKRPEGLTDFQWRIVRYLMSLPDGMASAWEIASTEFAVEWRKRAGHAAYIGHIGRACFNMQHLVGRIDPKDQWDFGTYFLRDR